MLFIYDSKPWLNLPTGLSVYFMHSTYNWITSDYYGVMHTGNVIGIKGTPYVACAYYIPNRTLFISFGDYVHQVICSYTTINNHTSESFVDPWLIAYKNGDPICKHCTDHMGRNKEVNGTPYKKRKECETFTGILKGKDKFRVYS